MNIQFDTYYNYAELTERLAWLAEQHPDIVTLAVLGQSYEGRDIPLVILTNKATGSDTDKPAFWVDGNIHAAEVTASAAALCFIVKMVEGYGQNPKITRMMDEQVAYVVPRVNPDGAELALSDAPRSIRSSTRPYPYEDRQDGLHPEDMDGDGRILQMRIEDPSGDWKVAERDPRLMVKRSPDEEGGVYYRLFSEGRIEGYDGHMINVAPPFEGLDLNRNFPNNWRPEGEQSGSGDYPGAEPETRALIAFITSHPNIFGGLTYHTTSRAILRPFSDRPDDEMDINDLWVYEAIGERGTEVTRYPNVSVYHHFRYHPKQVITGVYDDWLYDHRGIYAFTVELWDLPTASGIEAKRVDKKFIEWTRRHPVEDDYKILDFVNQHAPERLVAWYRFQHPQLGEIELGGWDIMYSWRNPPHSLLEAEVTPQAEFAMTFASLAPRIAWREVSVTPLGNGVYHLLASIENQGFLPTNGSQQAVKTKAARPVRFELTLPDGASLRSGKHRTDIGHLEGRSNKMDTFYQGSSPTDNRGKAEWLIHAPAGGAMTVQVDAGRGGTIRRQVDLGQ